MSEPRTDRAEEVSESRRNRFQETAQDPTLRRFGVSDEFLETDKYVYRAAVDDKTRLLQLTRNDDYDFVTAKGGKAARADSTGAEGVLRYQSGNNLDGSAQYTYLLRKPIKFADEHRKAAINKIDERESAILSGRQAPEGAPDKSYTPKR